MGPKAIPHPGNMNHQVSQNSDNEVRKTKKRRSRLGCTTCRRRKVRCDEQHPMCSACVRLKVPCKWKGDPNDLSKTLPLFVNSRPNDSPGSQVGISNTSGCTTYGTKSPTSVVHTIEESKKTVTITAEDQQPLQHFVTTMSKFCVLRNCVYDDLYGYILTNMALFHQPLFNAMMAWSFLHLSHLRKQPVEEAQRRYEAAMALLHQDLLDIHDADFVLTTIWFLLQYQLFLADGVDKFCVLLNIAADVTKGKLDKYETDPSTSPIGPIGCIVLVWMSARESQAAHFGGTGRLLGYLKVHPYMYDLIDQSSVVQDLSSNLHESESTLMRDCMRLSLRNMIVNGQITLLGRWKSPAADPSSWASVRASLAILRKEVEEDGSLAAVEALAVSKGSLTAMPKVSPLAYNRLLLLASYYGALISYYQSSPAIAPENSSDAFLDAEECAYRIIRITQRVTRDRPNSPQAFWPTILFKAATTVKDPIYQSWAVRTLELGEKWGVNLIKTRVLLENIIDRQNWSGMEVDFVKVMEETTGYFIV